MFQHSTINIRRVSEMSLFIKYSKSITLFQSPLRVQVEITSGLPPHIELHIIQQKVNDLNHRFH